MTRVTVPFVALGVVTDEEFPVRVADGLLTALLGAAPAGLYAGWFPPDVAVCLLWPGAAGAAREVYRFPAGRGFRTVLARFGYWYMGNQFYGGERWLLAEQDGRQFRVWLRMGNSQQTGCWLQATAEPALHRTAVK
jgi:hypothetical protein